MSALTGVTDVRRPDRLAEAIGTCRDREAVPSEVVEPVRNHIPSRLLRVAQFVAGAARHLMPTGGEQDCTLLIARHVAGLLAGK
jgi:hypothetical protein